MGMSDREAFIDWWESRHYDDEDREVKKAAWCAWQAAREQEGGEVVAWLTECPGSSVLFFNDEEERAHRYAETHGGETKALYTHPPQPQGVPAGFDLIPQRINLTFEDIANIVTVTGWDEGQDDFGEGVLWVGPIIDDGGNESHGLNISCIEVMEEGALPVHEFAKPETSTPAAPQADEWVSCADWLPTKKDEDERHDLWTCLEDVNGKMHIARNSAAFVEMFSEQTGPAKLWWKPTGLTRPQPPEQGDGV
jgi:hypothetical protein